MNFIAEIFDAKLFELFDITEDFLRALKVSRTNFGSNPVAAVERSLLVDV